MRASRLLLWTLLAVVLVRLLTLPVLPLIDPSESRYATIGRDMAVSGDLVTARVWMNGENIPFLGKPPLHLWLMSASFVLFGENEFAARFPSFLSSLALIGLLWWVAARTFNRRVATTAALILATCGAFFLAAGVVLLDPTFTLWVGGALLLYFAFLSEEDARAKRRLSLGVFLFLGLAVLTKGPVGLVLFGIPAFVWTLVHKEWRGLRHHAWTMGLLVFFAVVVPWFWAAEAANPGFLRYFLLNENLLRYIQSDYGDRYGVGHQRPYGTAILSLLAVAGPWSLWCLLLVLRRTARGAIRSFDRRMRFLLFCFLGITFFLCFARQFLWTYLLPALAPFALWLAVLVHRIDIPLKRVALVAACTALLLGPGQFFLRPYVEGQKETRTVARRALEHMEERGLGGGIAFFHDTPNGAFFYARGKVLPHDKHTWGTYLQADLTGPGGNLYAIETKHFDHLPPAMKDRLEHLETIGRWTLCVRR